MIAKALLGFFVAVILFNIFENGHLILQLTEHALQSTIECLSDFQLYIERKRLTMIYENLKKENRERRVYSPRSESEAACPRHSYRSRIIHRKPLLIYIENFLTEHEINHLIELAESNFKPSMVSTGEEGADFVDEYRTSTSAYINRHQTYIVKCLEQRFAQFQGGINVQHMEPFQLVKYVDNQESGVHYDWFPGSDISKNGGQRVTTFFTYLQSNCSMGETEFFSIPFNHSLHQQFCDILVCNKKSSQHGLRFRPLSRNTLFWYNIDEHGEGDMLTDHAGHPPGPNSYKIGLNTWTRMEKFYWPGDT